MVGAPASAWDPQLFKLSPSPQAPTSPPYPIPNIMSFEETLQLALDPTASEQLPRELHLGEYAWKNGKMEWKHRTPGFRKLRADELRQLMRSLQAAPQNHVVLLNLAGHDIGDDMMRELAEPIAALKALHVLILSCKSGTPSSEVPSDSPTPYYCFVAICTFSHAADNEIGASGCAAVAGALPHLLALQELHLSGNCFRYIGLCFAA